MSWSFLDFTGLSRFFGRLPEKLVTTDTTQTISGTKSFSSTILGSVSGSAASASKDGAGNVIADTYETKEDAATHLSKSDAASTCVQTGAVDQTVAGTKTFSKPIVGSVTGSSGSCTGNAATANIATRADSATKAANADHATSADSATRATSADRALAVQTSDYHAIRFDWDSLVPYHVGLTVDVTPMGGIVTTYGLVSAIRAQWYAAYPDGPEAHNAMWGGRDITAAFDAGTVSEHIADGTFRDIFPGDYITKQVTISGTAYNVNWVVADCDYWINKGDTAMTAHHVVIVPQGPIFYANMNDTNTTEGGYMGSRMFKETIPACATGIVNAFGASHILTFRDWLIPGMTANQISSGLPNMTGGAQWGVSSWVSVQCDLMTEKMVLGAPVNSASALDEWCATRQFSAFRLSERLINYNRQTYWLRNIVSSAFFADVNSDGIAIAYNASVVLGVRPFALLV